MTVSVRMAIAAQPMRHRAVQALPVLVTGLLALVATPVLAQAPLPPGAGVPAPGFGTPIGAPVAAPIGGTGGGTATPC